MCSAVTRRYPLDMKVDIRGRPGVDLIDNFSDLESLNDSKRITFYYCGTMRIVKMYKYKKHAI